MLSDYATMMVEILKDNGRPEAGDGLRARSTCTGRRTGRGQGRGQRQRK